VEELASQVTSGDFSQLLIVAVPARLLLDLLHPRPYFGRVVWHREKAPGTWCSLA
jgi:hypothetical protein